MSTNFTTYILTHPWILFVAAAWIIPWKGIALWRAAQNRSYVWFIFFLIVNTLGILEIIYIFFFSRKKFVPQVSHATNNSNDYENKVIDIKKQ